MLRRTCTAGVAFTAVLVAGCGRAATPAGLGGDGSELLAGAPGDCQLLESWDADVHGRVLAAIEAGVSHGPLVVARADDQAVVASTTYESPGVELRSAAWMIDKGTLIAVNDEAVRISSTAARVIDSAGDDALAGAMAQAEDCSLVAADRSAPDPPQPEPEMRPDLMVIEPAVAAPGEELALRFPKETPRGIAFELHRRTDRRWVTTHWMNSDANGIQIAGTAPVGTDGFGSDDLGVGGPGPDRVALPGDIQSGEYRVCTANAGDEFCAPLTITMASPPS